MFVLNIMVNDVACNKVVRSVSKYAYADCFKSGWSL